VNSQIVFACLEKVGDLGIYRFLAIAYKEKFVGVLHLRHHSQIKEKGKRKKLGLSHLPFS
jgi:hypothetical protein